MQAIERAAGALFAAVGMAEVAEGEPTPLAALEGARRRGDLLVLADAQDRPLGWGMLGRVDGEPHLLEIDVDPAHGRRGLGTLLLEALVACARAQGGRGLTLTTFRDLPWNGPWYARHGFRALPDAALGPELAHIRRREREEGLDAIAPRVAMRRRLGAADAEDSVEPTWAPRAAAGVRRGATLRRMREGDAGDALRPGARRPRPERIEPVGPGQESVWDYPRPPRLEPARRPVRIELGGRVIAASRRAWRVCETAGPPVYYVPLSDVDPDALRPSATTSFCEWKGEARYVDLRAGGRVARDAGFRYPHPRPGFEPLRDALGVYPGRVDACYLGDERVRPQPGDYYAGWVTADVKGPFKGEPGTEGW